MNTFSQNQKDKIEHLQMQIREAEQKISSLKETESQEHEKLERYSYIFNKSYLSLWEIDVSSVYRALEQRSSDDGYELDNASSQFRIINVNDYSVELFGAKNKKELKHNSSFPGKDQIFKCILSNVSVYKSTVTVKGLNGKTLNLLLTAALPGKSRDHLLLCMMDMNKRTKMEESLSLLIRNEKEQKRRTEVLQNNLLVLTSSVDKEQLLQAILNEVGKLIPYTCANILLLEKGYLKTAALIGYENYKVADIMRNASIKLEELGAASGYLQRGEIYIIPDTHKSSSWTKLPQTEFVRSYIGVPIKGLKGYEGLLCLDSDIPDTYSQSDSSILQLFAYAASAALQSSQLFEHTKKELNKRQETEKILKESLEEKNILLKEIHHRVKNNLALIMSLINLQSGMLKDKSNQSLFEELKQRIFTISLVHRRMYSSRDLREVDLYSYLKDLTETMKTSSSFKMGTMFKLEVKEAVSLEMDLLVPLALLLNELIINAVKYAFPEKPGIIKISAVREKTSCTIVFRDSGIGYPSPLIPSSNQMGLSLVESLTSQIGGSIAFKNDNGAVAVLVFPL